MEEEIGRVPAWITVGGSYPGALSAWFKHLYPDHAAGSWSSSGVIHAIEDFRNFDLDIYTATAKSGDLCPATIQAHYKFIENAFETNSTQTEEICDIFGIPVDHLNKHDFFFYLADIYTLGVQYGMRTYLCDFLMANADEDMMDQLKAVADFGNSQGMYYDQYDAVALQDTTIDINLNLRQWTYQYCTEFGFYQTPNLEHPMRSSYIDFEFWPDYCHRIFGDEMPELDVDATNAVFGGLNITGDNIFFANAIEDPWQWAGMRQIHDPTIQSTMEAEIVDCTDCGHCIDLHAQVDSNPEALTNVQNDIAATVAEWLEEFDAAQESTAMFLQA